MLLSPHENLEHMDIMHWRVGHVTALAGITSFNGGGSGGAENHFLARNQERGGGFWARGQQNNGQGGPKCFRICIYICVYIYVYIHIYIYIWCMSICAVAIQRLQGNKT